jgi:hypothetical protein
MELNGLPLHPLVVHAVVVLGPLTALCGLAYAAVPRWRWLLRWPLVAAAVGLAVAAYVAVLSGHAMEDANPALHHLVEQHHEYGERLRNWSIAFVACAALAAWTVGGPSPLVSGRGARLSRGVVGWVALGLLVVGSIGLLVLVFLTGESGARAVWGG